MYISSSCSGVCYLVCCLFVLYFVVFVFSWFPFFFFCIILVFLCFFFFFFFQAEDGIRDWSVTGVQTCALPISWTSARITGRRERVRSSDAPCRTESSAPSTSSLMKSTGSKSRAFRTSSNRSIRTGSWLVGCNTSGEIGRASCRERVQIRGVAEQ